MKKQLAILSLLLLLISCKAAQKKSSHTLAVPFETGSVYNFSTIKGYDYSQALIVSSKDKSKAIVRLDGKVFMANRNEDGSYSSNDGLYHFYLNKSSLVLSKEDVKKEFKLTQYKTLDYAYTDQKQFLFNYVSENDEDVKMLVYLQDTYVLVRVNGSTVRLYKKDNIYVSKDENITLELSEGKAIYNNGSSSIVFNEIDKKDMYYALEIREYIYNFMNKKEKSKIMVNMSPDSDTLVFRKDKVHYKAKKIAENQYKTEDETALLVFDEVKGKLRLTYITKDKKVEYVDLGTKDPFFAR